MSVAIKSTMLIIVMLVCGLAQSLYTEWSFMVSAAIKFIILSVIKLSVIKLSVIKLSVIKLSVIKLSVIKPCVIWLMYC